MRKRVIGIGETVLDILFKNDQPQKAVPGGSTFNSIVSLGRAGVPCAMVTETGSDHVGDLICAFLKANGVSDEYVCRHPGTKSHITLAFLNEHNDAQYTFYKDHATALLDEQLPVIQADDIVLFGSFFAINPVIRPVVGPLLREAKKAGAWLYYDINFRKSHIPDIPDVLPNIEENMRLADLVRGSKEDFEYLYDLSDADAIYAKVRPFCSTFILTDGAREIRVYTPAGCAIFPVQPIETVSTVGAGDNFNAGYIYAMLQGLDNQAERIAMAQRWSQDVCRQIGNNISDGLVAWLKNKRKNESTNERIAEIVDAQRRFFRTGRTLPVKWRIKQLKRLKEAVIAHRQEFVDALAADLGRSEVEAYLCDVGPIIVEINEMISGLRRWSRPEIHFSGLMCFPSLVTKVYKMPYGVSLVISPFNFPILLTIGVVAAAMCGGNTVVIKSSSKSAACTAVLKKFFAEVFPPEYITLIDGGHDVADMCLAQRFDKIFYTGSPAVGKHVLAEAAKHLTPVALELGGETGNWCVVRADADLKDAARKIAFFKLTNAGQICININQIAVAEEVAEAFLSELKAAFIAQIGEHAETNPEYPKLITEAAYDKCARLADEYRNRILFGGAGDKETRKYAPTVIYPVGIDEHIVLHELFCPLLPVVPFKDAEADALMDVIADREHPLAMYLFTRNIRWANRVMQTQQFGGGCINEVCIHMMVKGVPFNGTGHSGMGAYHGEWGFREFTHPQTVLRGHTRFNLPLREHPYTGEPGRRKMALLRWFER